MEFLVVDIGATIATLVGYLGIVIWHDVRGEPQTASRASGPRGAANARRRTPA